MTTKNDFQDLEDLRKDYNLILEKYSENNEKAPEKRIRNIKSKLSGTRGWYTYRFIMFLLGLLAVPAIFLWLKSVGIYEPHFTYYLVFFLILSTCSFLADLHARRVLSPDKLPYMSLKEATEHVINHKKVRQRVTMVSLPFYVIFVAWTLHIASRGTWDFSHMIYGLILMVVCFVIGLLKIKKNREDLESICQGIED